MESSANEMQTKLRTLQIIHAALIFGAATFAVIALIVPAQGQQGAVGSPDMMIFRLVWGGVFVSMLVAVLVIRSIAPRAAGQQIGSDAPADAYFSPFLVMSIIRAAMLEGVSLFGGIILLLSGESMDLALAIMPLAVMIPMFPTRSGFESFVNRATGRQREEGLTAPSREFQQYR